MENAVRISLDGSEQDLILEYGLFAKQADGACVAKLGETVVLATVVYNKEDKDDVFFLPLTVDYRERTYAAGKIPGGFFKREGRPSEREILVSRLIDRSIRQLFPDNWYKETVVNVLVLSFDGENDPDVLSVVAAGAALRLSSIPVVADVSAVRVGKIENKFILNPTLSQQSESILDIVVSGTSKGVVMVEAGAFELEEKEIIAAIEFAQGYIKKIISSLEALPRGEKINVTFQEGLQISQIREKISSLLTVDEIKSIAMTSDKKTRENLWDSKKKEIIASLIGEYPEFQKVATYVLEEMFYKTVRDSVLNEGIRADGRKVDEVRPIECAVRYLKRPHGNALFQRGQTQAFATVTLGTPDDKQIMDVLEGEYKERFLFHYNFPGFATGEARLDRGVSRREQGHGALARRALYPVMPSEDEFPYTIRIVSDIFESNGSSSMASVCAGSLALFDAGVPIRSAVAGVAMGLIKEGDKYVVLTDIMGMEDHIGDMDFKVAGTRKGITALQMDLKIPDIDLVIMTDALEKARLARHYILDVMEKTLAAPREKISDYAPQLEIINIHPSKIGALIGPGGKNIKKITEESKAEIVVENDGKVYISAMNAGSLELARQMVDYYTAEAEVGKVYKGRVTRVLPFGAVVEILPGKEGLVHISQFSYRRIDDISDIVKEGDEINVKVIEVDERGRINLSCKGLVNNFQEGRR